MKQRSGYYDLYIGSKEPIKASSLAYYFKDMKYVDSISFDNLVNKVFEKDVEGISFNDIKIVNDVVEEVANQEVKNKSNYVSQEKKKPA